MLRAIEYAFIKWTSIARMGGAFLVLLIVAVTGAVGWYAANHLSVNTDTSEMLDPSLDFQVQARKLRDAFPSIKEDVVVVIDGATVDEAEAFTDALAERLSTRDDAFREVFAPSASAFFRRNGLLFLPLDDLSDRMERLSQASSLIETLATSQTSAALFDALADNDSLAEQADLGAEALDRIYDELAIVAEASISGETRPFAWLGAFAGDGGNGDDESEATGDSPPPGRRLIYATPNLDFTRLQPAKPALTALKADIAELTDRFDGRVEALVTGDPALRAEELSAVSSGIGASFALSLILVAVLLYFAFRSTYLVVATLLSLLVTLVLTAGFAAATVGELNLVSVAFTVLLVGLGLDFAIHLLAHVQERRTGGQSLKSALRGAAHDVGAGLTLAAPTTALGFFAFTPTRFDGIAQLGIIAGAGVLIAFAVAATLLPALMGAAAPPAPRRQGRIIQGVFRLLERGSIPISIIAIGAGIYAATLLPQARFDADPMSLRDPASPSVRGFEKLFDDAATTPYRASLLAAGENDASAIAARAETIPEIGSVRSLASFVPANQLDKLDVIDFTAGGLAFALQAKSSEEDPNASPAARDAAAARLMDQLEDSAPSDAKGRLLSALDALRGDRESFDRFDAQLFAYWPQLTERLFAQLEASEITATDLPQSLTERYVASDGQWRVDLLPSKDVRDHAALERFVDAVESAFPDAAGGAVQAEAAGEVIAKAMIEATGIALIAVTLILWTLMRRFDNVLLVLFPIALAAILTIGTSVLLDLPFNYANVIVLPLLLGIGVDSGIHLVLRERHMSHGADVFQTSTPSAVFFSATTTVASFGSLMLSAHRGTASMGQLLSIAIAFTLVCTLIVLPAAMRLRRGRKPGRA
ncbi:MAG: MMPL family transporter [Alphaproteobacteria bacterium]|nr:MMPL family transporter [Alphaproteobacteria bacterium]